MDENDETKPIHRKLDKHFYITVNGKRVKILNYKIFCQNMSKQGYQVIELITKISSEHLTAKNVHIIIERQQKTIAITGILHGIFSQPGLSRYQFRIESFEEKGKDVDS